MSVTTTDLWAYERHGPGVCHQIPRRIEAVNPLINAVTVVLGEQVLEAAKAADRAVAGGGDLPPLHGVPFTVKENIDLAGTPTTVGLRAPVLAEPVRVALVVGPAGQVSADQVQDGVRKAASALEERVGIITPIDPR